jgi:galactitol-specific phosphotransferase system IIB component
MKHIKPYNEVTFAIDLISDAYKTADVFTIIQKCKEELDVEVNTSQVLDYLFREDDMEKQSREIEFSLNSNELFSNYD